MNTGYEGLRQEFVKKAESQKRIRVQTAEISDITRRVIRNLELFNCIEEGADVIGTKVLTNIPIPNEVAGLIEPESVRQKAGCRIYPDMLVRRKTKDLGSPQQIAEALEKFNFNDWINAISDWRRLFGRSADEDCTSLAVLRSPKAVSDVIDHAVFNIEVDCIENGHPSTEFARMVQFSEQGFIPYELDVDLVDIIVPKKALVLDESDVILQYFADMKLRKA